MTPVAEPPTATTPEVVVSAGKSSATLGVTSAEVAGAL